MGQTFGAWFTIRVEAKDGAATLDRGGTDSSRIPFVPQPGMRFAFGEDGDEEEYEVAAVTWCMPQDCWWITLKTDSVFGRDRSCPCKVEDRCCVLDNILPWWADNGWGLMERWEWEKERP